MKDFQLTMRLRNNRLKQRREELGLSAKQFSERVGLNYYTYCSLEGLRRSPFNTRGEWSVPAQKIALYHGMSCDELWPPSVLRVVCPKVERKVDAAEIVALLPPSDTPEALLMGREDDQRLNVVTRNLSERELYVLTRRANGGMLREIANETGLSRERVRRIESQAAQKAAKVFSFVERTDGTPLADAVTPARKTLRYR